jgi:hypothetical protein
MRRTLAFSLFTILGSIGLAPEAAVAQSAPSCIQSRGEARYGASAYNHVVIVANACAIPADCVVSTNVNPEPQKVSVPAKSAIEVVTFLGSPAREFTPHVSCKMRN